MDDLLELDPRQRGRALLLGTRIPRDMRFDGNDSGKHKQKGVSVKDTPLVNARWEAPHYATRLMEYDPGNIQTSRLVLIPAE